MKKLIIIILILMFLPVSIDAAENQSIIFSGSYSVNNGVTDADSAWLYLAYYDTDIDSVLVTAQSEGWGGYYRYAHLCTNDSVWGWSGRWVYITNSPSIRLGEDATVTSARDSSYALHTQVDSLKDTTEDMSTRLLATGFSTHSETDIWDLTTDGHTGAGTFGLMLESCSLDVASLGGWNPSNENLARDATKDNYKATGFSTHSAGSVWDLTTDAHTGAGSFGLMLESCSTSVLAVRDTAQYLVTSDGDTNQAATPWTAAESDSILNAIADANKPNFHSDGDTNKFDWDAAFAGSLLAAITDVNKPNFQSDGDTNQFNLLFDGDSVIIDWSTGWFAAGSGLDSATTSRIVGRKIWGEAVGAVGSTDSINAIARHTVPDTTGLMHENDTIGIAADVYAELIDGNNEDQFKADVSGLSTLADNDIRVALGDTLYNSRTDSILAVLATVAADVLDIAYYWGACDGCYYRLYPESGTSNKDSAIIIDPSLGVDSMVAKVVYLHGTDVQVVDTVYFYRDEPW